MSPNRVVAVLTPLVFAPAAGVVATWAAENLPGVQVSQGALEEIFIGGALIAFAPALQWLHGWQKHEAREAQAQQAVEVASAVAAEPEQLDEFEQFDELEAVDEFGELDELEDLEDLDDSFLADEEQPARSGG